MSTQTTVINGQSFGTSTNVGNQKFSISPTTLQTGTTGYIVNVKVTLGTDQPCLPSQKVRVWYTTNVDSVAAADAPEQLGSTANYVDVILDRKVRQRDSFFEVNTGLYFNCWVDAPTLTVASTVTVKLNELP